MNKNTVIMLLQEYVKLLQIAIQTNDTELYTKTKYNILNLLDQLSPQEKQEKEEVNSEQV